MIKIHYGIWAGMCATAFAVGAYIPAQADYIRSQAKIEVYSDLPVAVLSQIPITEAKDDKR